MKQYRRLPLSGLSNARDLGGFYTQDGKVTQYRRFIRSEVPNEVTETDISFLAEYGVKEVIDFRGSVELSRMPNLLALDPRFRFHHIPTYNSQVARGAGISRDRPFVRWAEMYVEMCEGNKSWVKSVFETFASSDGAFMFNCTTGKDRTGMISAMLLGLAGVSDFDIIADYCVSEVYMREKYIKLFKKMPPLGEGYNSDPEKSLEDPFFRTSPDNMRFLLEHMTKEYGGVYGYLVSCGIEREALERAASLLTDEK